MTLAEHLRNKAFWVLDAIRGGGVRESLELLSSIEGSAQQPDAAIEAYHKKQIQNLLRHCVETVPAYANLGHTLTLENPILNWPVVNKLSFAKSAAGRHMSTAYDRDSLIAMTTSGSTGTPFTCWQDCAKKRHVNAEVLHYNGKIGYKIGKRIIYFRSVVSEVAKSPLQQRMQNIHLIDCTDLSDQGIKCKLKQIRELSRHGGAMILSYASTLDAFRRYFEKHGFGDARGCKIYGIVSGSEMLHDATRKSLSDAFCCKVVSRYSNEENGFLGQDDQENNVFIHNRADYFIEILKLDSDEPAEMGQVGRIVVTDLYNYAMPMVRYDTGDVGAWQEVDICGIKRRAIGKFGGRKVDMIFDIYGNPISPHAITNSMWKYTDIKQFQFIQVGRSEYLLRINSNNPIDSSGLIETCMRIVGNGAKISIETCDEIPVLASGKRRYIVNMMESKGK